MVKFWMLYQRLTTVAASLVKKRVKKNRRIGDGVSRLGFRLETQAVRRGCLSDALRTGLAGRPLKFEINVPT